MAGRDKEDRQQRIASRAINRAHECDCKVAVLDLDGRVRVIPAKAIIGTYDKFAAHDWITDDLEAAGLPSGTCDD